MKEISDKSGPRLEQLNRLVDDVLSGMDLFRVDTHIGGSGRVPKLDVFIDGDSGVTIDQCAVVSRSLRATIQLEGILGSDFGLDVSSPGLGRPLVLPRQYKRHLGRNLDVVYRRTDEGESARIVGRLNLVADDMIVIEKEDEKFEIRYDEIEKAIVTPSF